MDIDPDIANWVLEFLLRQPLEDRILNSLLRALPLANDNAHLKKMLLLRKLESEVSRSPICEDILGLLEQLEELEFRQGNGLISDAMKRAYCAVAVECTVRFLENGVNEDISRKFKFFEAVKRVWRGKIGRMEKMVEKGGLGSEELSTWKDEIEAAVWDDSVCASVVKKSAGADAAEAVKAYMREEREKMGPSFLELVAEKVKNDEVMQGVIGMKSGDRLEARKKTPSSRVRDASNVGNEMAKKKIKLRDKLVGVRHSRGSASGNSRGAKIVSPDETTTTGPIYRNYNIQSSAEVDRVREALGSSASDLHAVVKDPLPDALQFAQGICSDSKKDKTNDPEKDNRDKTNDLEKDNRAQPNTFIVDGAGVVQGNGCDASSAPKPSMIERNITTAPKPSMMERNITAHTYKWDESIDRSEEDPDSRGGRLMLPSPEMMNMSPLDRYDIKNLKRRRRGRRWSLVEEDTLRTGVQTFGKGNWKLILSTYPDVFADRTEVDLKDKWRNLTRHG